MNQVQDTIKHIKGKQLNFAQRVVIQIRTQDGWSPYRIAKELGCAANTIRNELRRGTPDLYWNKQTYDADIVQQICEGYRINSHRTPIHHLKKGLTNDTTVYLGDLSVKA